MTSMDNRTLSDDDVRAIAAQIEHGITQRFQLNVGRGVLALVWRTVLYMLIGLAAYGAGSGAFKKFF